ncbi:MAG TPA: hypothetical protein VG843_05630 [Rhizomicrobium sp.]|jgi:hypothetical protein|nr:hypothetical protein [Rhizomicrobium sp.]
MIWQRGRAMQISPHNLLLASQYGARNAQRPAGAAAAQAPAARETGGFAPLSFKRIEPEPRAVEAAPEEPAARPGARLDIRI